MSYTIDKNRRGGYNAKNSIGLSTIESNPGRGSNTPRYLFYELEAAEVVDVILTEDDLDKLEGTGQRQDFTMIGACKVRRVISEVDKDEQNLSYARPLESNIKRIPLKHEIVIVADYLGDLYYTQKMNYIGSPNQNASPGISLSGIRNETSSNRRANEYQDIETSGNPNLAGEDLETSLGDTFQQNINIKPLQPEEGDLIFEGRFGNSIRIGSNPENNQPSIKMKVGQPTEVPDEYLRPITENINQDPTSLWLTTNELVELNPSTIDSEVHFRSAQNPPDEYNGNQIVMNSDRIILNSKTREILSFSRRSTNFMSLREFSIDSGREVLITSNGNTVLTSPRIFLGSEDAEEPIVLGRIMVDLVKELTNQIISHTHATGTGPSSPPNPPEITKLQKLVSQFESALSRQNFTL